MSFLEVWKKDGNGKVIKMRKKNIMETFINQCDRQAIKALRYLADNDRPAGGAETFNSEHLLQIANELEASSVNKKRK